jgi:hypothetical protein
VYVRGDERGVKGERRAGGYIEGDRDVCHGSFVRGEGNVTISKNYDRPSSRDMWVKWTHFRHEWSIM